MAIALNQYASKVYSEHPIALWPLDEQAYYLSLIDDTNRLFTNWTLTGCTASNSPTIPDTPSPFDSDIYSSLTKSTTTAGTIQAVSNTGFGILDIDPAETTVTVNLFLYQNPTYINWFKIGIRYLSGGTQTILSDSIPAPTSVGWINLNKTFDLPNSFTGDIVLVLQVDFAASGAGDTASRTVIMNGLSVGQGSSLTCYESLGSTAVDLPSELGFVTSKGIPADQYGIPTENGYYMVKNNAILAHNDGMAMIYGTDHCTIIEPSGTADPSLIFPGKGMLHENGRSKDYTLEIWLKIDPRTYTAKKIVGPLDSNDGIYVKEGFITLSIGDEVGSHYVDQWYRPMLVHMILKDKKAVLLINGEQVITIDYDRSVAVLSELRDWWGVYSNSSINYFSVDCIGIYPYVVSTTVAKRRFVYGQGTPNIQSLDAAYSGTPTTIDFSTSQYGSSVIYPDAYRWDAGYFNNLDATRDYLSVPKYSLPVINLQGRDVDQWYADNLTVNNSEYPDGTHPKFISFRPNQVTRVNMVTNPSVETNTTNIAARGTGTTIARITTDFNFGTACIEVTKGAVASAGIGVHSGSTVRMPVQQFKQYATSAYVKIPAGQEAGGLRLRVVPFNYAGTQLTVQSSTTTSITSAMGWTRLSFVATMPATATSAYVIVEQPTAGTAGQKFLVDNILFEESTVVLPYFDGSYYDPSIKLINHGWTGTADASTSTLSYWNPDGINYQDQYYFNFPTMNILNDQVYAAYGIFEADSNIATSRTLMSFVNTTNGDTFDITISTDDVTYSINGTQLYTEVITIGEEFLVGINFLDASLKYGYDVSRFFSSPSSIQLYVGGNGENTFEGKIFIIGLCNETNYSLISDNFYTTAQNGGGLSKTANYSILVDHIASYTLVPEYEYGKLFLDISIAAQWEEFYPLSYFASYTKDSEGNPVYDIDALQFNIGYVTVESSGVWTYQDLKTEFSSPSTYNTLRTSSYAGSYFNLRKKNTTGNTVNVSNSSLQAYVTFQRISDGANAPLSSFDMVKPLDAVKAVYADAENTIVAPTRAYETKFQVVDDMIIYPPKSQDFQDYALVVHLQISQRSIIRNPLKIKRMEISAKNYNENSTTGAEQRTFIGTKFGKNIYPYAQQVSVLNNKGKKVFTISKETVPYLYNASKNGIGVLKESSLSTIPVDDTQIFIPINDSATINYIVAALQFMVKPEFVEEVGVVRLMEVTHKGGTVAYCLVKNGSNTATIREYVKSGTGYIVDGGAPNSTSFSGNVDNGLAPSTFFYSTIDFYEGFGTLSVNDISYTASSGSSYYQNGRYVPSPILNNNEWAVIGIVPSQSWDFGNFTSGGITIFGGARFNNISYYLSEGLGIRTELSTRVWQQVLDAQSAGTTPWSYWNGTSWQSVYLLGQTSSFVVTPGDIYDVYVGTNGSVIDDGYGLSLNQGQMKVVSDATWSLVSGKPA